MKAITFSSTTQQPLLATSFQGDPNSDVSYNYIPGSTLRGAVIGRYLKQQGISDLDRANDFAEVRRLFFNSNCTRYLNGYLSAQSGKRTLPSLRSWRKEKGVEFSDEGPRYVFDFSLGDEDFFEGSEREDPKPIGDSHFWIEEEDERIYLHSPKRRINIHTKRDRQHGKASKVQKNPAGEVIRKAEGEIFRYDALDAHQTFQAVILCADEDVATLQTLLEAEDLWLGGSRSAGYGHTKLHDVEVCDDWCEVGLPAEQRSFDDRTIITLLSDLIVRNEYGQPIADWNLVGKEIECLLRLKLPESTQAQAFTGRTLVGGFNRKWGLPLPQVPAIAAGSVIIFKQLSLTGEQIKTLEEQGLGDRREDGFGRLAVNLQVHWESRDTLQVQLPQSSSSRSTKPLSDTSLCLARKMANRLLEQKLEQKVQNKLAHISSLEGGISNSQLSRLQSVARNALATQATERVKDFLSQLTSSTKKKFQNVKLGGRSFYAELERWLDNPQCWINNPQDLKTVVADVECGLTDKLAKKYTLLLIIAVAKKAAKERVDQ